MFVKFFSLIICIIVCVLELVSEYSAGGSWSLGERVEVECIRGFVFTRDEIEGWNRESRV